MSASCVVADCCLRIHLSARVAAQRMQIRLADNGSGIPESQREEVFTLFRRLVSNQTEGTGIGLPLARKLIRQAGGHLWIEDGLEQGTSLVFDLPLVAEKERDE